MCSIWQKQRDFKELNFEQIEKIFSQKEFASYLEIINFTGGEPTLHPDFEKLLKLWVKKLSNLRRIDMPTNGIQTEIVKDRIMQALSILSSYPKVKFCVTVSVDGIDEIYDEIRGMENGFEKVKKTITELKDLMKLYSNFSLSLNAVITRLNYDKLWHIREFANKEGLYLNYTLGAISEIGVESVIQKEKFSLIEKEKSEVTKFLINLKGKGEIEGNYADFLIHYLKYGRRKGRCNFLSGKALLLDANGKLYRCGNYKAFYMGDMTQESFSRIQKRFKLPKGYRKICEKCASNCYRDEK